MYVYKVLWHGPGVYRSYRCNSFLMTGHHYSYININSNQAQRRRFCNWRSNANLRFRVPSVPNLTSESYGLPDLVILCVCVCLCCSVWWKMEKSKKLWFAFDLGVQKYTLYSYISNFILNPTPINPPSPPPTPSSSLTRGQSSPPPILFLLHHQTAPSSPIGRRQPNKKKQQKTGSFFLVFFLVK